MEDPIVQGMRGFETINRYSYVLNNPVNLIDPFGLQSGLGAIKTAGEVKKATNIFECYLNALTQFWISKEDIESFGGDSAELNKELRRRLKKLLKDCFQLLVPKLWRQSQSEAEG